MKNNNYVCSPYAVFKREEEPKKQRFLNGSQLQQVWKARDTAAQLRHQVENLPCWILDTEDWGAVLDAMDKVRTILNTSKEVIDEL